jgi:protein-tyrosine phosphatase
MNPNDIVEIIPHLFISNWDTSNNPDVLINNNINAVITLETMPKPQKVLDFYANNNIEYMYIEIGDSPYEDISQYFDMTYDFIKKYISQGKNVLVHCMAGISRSSTIILNYIIRDMYENNRVQTCPCRLFQDVLEYARERRHIINPNIGFKKHLLLKAMEYQHQQGNQNQMKYMNMY